MMCAVFNDKGLTQYFNLDGVTAIQLSHAFDFCKRYIVSILITMARFIQTGHYTLFILPRQNHQSSTMFYKGNAV